MALMMMSGSSSKAQTASPSDTKIMTFTVGDYQEFKKDPAPDSEDQEENNSTVDLTAIKTDWTSQQAREFRDWKNDSDAEYSYSFLTKAELQDASDKGTLTGSLSNQWILSEDGEELLLVASSEDIGVLSLRQNSKTPSSSFRNDGGADSVDHRAQQNNTSSTSDAKLASKSTTWFTTRNMLVAGGILLVCADVAFVALGGPVAFGLCSAGAEGGSSTLVDSFLVRRASTVLRKATAMTSDLFVDQQTKNREYFIGRYELVQEYRRYSSSW